MNVTFEQAYLVVVVALGTLLLLGMAVLAWRLWSVIGTSRHRSKREAYVDLLQWAVVVADGVVITKNGSLMTTFLIQGQDTSSLTEIDREVAAMRLNDALQLGDGWAMHFDACRVASPGYMPRSQSHFSSRVAFAMDEERRTLFETLGAMYETETIVTFTYTPPIVAARKLAELMFHDSGAKKVNAKSRHSAIIETFQRDTKAIESRLSAVYRVARLGPREVPSDGGGSLLHDDMLSHLHRCATGLMQPIAAPRERVYLDHLLGNVDFTPGVIPKVGEYYVQVIALSGLPPSCFPGILQELAELPCVYRWSTRFIFTDAHVAESLLAKMRKKWKQKERGLLDQALNRVGHLDEAAVEMVDDAGSAMKDLQSGEVVAGFYNSQIVLLHEDRGVLEAQSETMRSCIERLGFGARIETVNTNDAFFSTLPGHTYENVRRPVLNSLNVAYLLPISAIWTGELTAPNPLLPDGSPPLLLAVTPGSQSPIRVNLHMQDLGHTAIFGRTRSGKSTLVSLLAAQFDRYEQAQVHVLEVGRASVPMITGMGGAAHDVGRGRGYAPLADLSTAADRAWATNWIDDILALNNFETTAEQRVEIGHAITSHHEGGGRSLTDFVAELQDHELRAALTPYTVSGSMGHLLDSEEDGLDLALHNAFELGELQAYGTRYLLPTMDYIFRRIEKSLHGQLSVVVFDECWFAYADPRQTAKLRNWLKTKAKANMTLILSTQNMDDAPESLMNVLIESTASKIFLPNAYARANESTTALYRRFGLNDAQIDLIATAIPKQDYYIVKETGSRLFQLALGPLALAFCGSGDLESLAVIDALREEHGEGDSWVDAWCARKGLSLSDYLNSEDVARIEAEKQRFAA